MRLWREAGRPGRKRLEENCDVVVAGKKRRNRRMMRKKKAIWFCGRENG